jgi:azurin
MRTPRVSFLAGLGLAILVAGCGKNESSSSTTTTASGSGNAAGTSAGAPTAASGRAIEITGNDTMKFSLTEIRAKPGETLSVTLANVGTMPKMSMGHNWVLLKTPGVVDAFAADSAQAPTTDYIAVSRKEDILAHTKLLGPKERDTVTFQAPKQPGRYPFLCTFPGHYQVGMKGELIVE